jgi:chorismate--pyruvate lyase
MTRWKPIRHYLRADIPRPLCSWLLDTASLTLRLQQLCPDGFRVRVLSQVCGRPTLDEARVLGMRSGGKGIIRQVQLLCDGQPWVYARTIIPMSSLRGKLRRLAHLGTRPLGGMLFAEPGMRRGRVELACISKGHPMYEAATRSLQVKPAGVWGRRSVFRIAHKPLLVSEIFLPTFPTGQATEPLWKSR